MAARDADYAAMSWYPELPGLDLWRATYRRVARANGAEPDTGRRLRAWARAAGLTGARVTTSAWTYADPAACRRWGESQAERYSGEVFTAQAREAGATAEELSAVADAWRRWAADPDATFVIVHGELLAQV